MNKVIYLKASEVAQRLNVKHVTVRAWLKRDLFPNAKLEETIAGSIWLIPESDLENFKKPEMGRPSKAKQEAETREISTASTKKN